jgi:hypothetical protein
MGSSFQKGMRILFIPMRVLLLSLSLFAMGAVGISLAAGTTGQWGLKIKI